MKKVYVILTLNPLTIEHSSGSELTARFKVDSWCRKINLSSKATEHCCHGSKFSI